MGCDNCGNCTFVVVEGIKVVCLECGKSDPRYLISEKELRSLIGKARLDHKLTDIVGEWVQLKVNEADRQKATEHFSAVTT